GYYQFRRIVSTYNTLEMTASSTSDAALRFITHLAGTDAWKPLSILSNGRIHCRVITFGITAWDKKHKTRTFTHSVYSEEINGLENYQLASSIFPNRWQAGEKFKEKDDVGNTIEHESHFLINSTAREFISDNIAQGRDWYYDLSELLSRKEVRKGLSYRKEREGLNKMVREARFEDKTEKLFIDLCQESWRRRMGKIANRAGMEGADPQKLVQ